MPRKLSGSSGDKMLDMSTRQLLAESMRPLILREYQAALLQGVEIPIVFLFDCEDEMGYPSAMDFGISDQEIDAQLAARDGGAAKEARVVLARSRSYAEVRKSPLAQVFVNRLDKAPMADEIAVIIISMNGVSGTFVKIHDT